MTLYALGEKSPQIADTAWIAPDANVIGDIVVEEDGSIWFGATLRGDNEPIVLGARSNIQENCVLHTDPGFPLTIGESVTVGHQAMLHGCTIGDDCLIGMQSILLNGSVIGSGSLVAAGSLVMTGKEYPENSLIVGRPAKVIGEVRDKHREEIRRACESYLRRSALYRDSLQKLS